MNTLELQPNRQSQITAFPRDLHAFFGTYKAMHSVPREEMESWQLAVLKERFGNLRDKVPILKKLADGQHAEKIETLDDAVPLLFSHTVYKSYPISLLENNRFTQLTQWLNKLTSIDLSGVDVSQCRGIDEWFEAMDRQTPLQMRHSSGTSGLMSFIPRAYEEADRHFLNLLFTALGAAGLPVPEDRKPLDMHLVLPTYRSGNYGSLRAHKFYFKYIAGDDPAKIHILYPRHQSSDMLFLAGRLRLAKQNGELDRLNLNPILLERKAEYEAIQSNMGEDLETFLADMVRNLSGQRIYAQVLSNQLYNISTEGLSKGISGVFASDSIILTGGGAKGQVLPSDWKDKAKQFCGVSEIVHSYGMSEVMAAHMMCSHNRYHASPAAIFYVLDPDTGAALPRKGTQTGRAAFFDLVAETYWGGFVTGDEITVEWDKPCGCGLKSVHMSPDIGRYSEKRGGDDKISCAAATEAHDEALDFLTSFAG